MLEQRLDEAFDNVAKRLRACKTNEEAADAMLQLQADVGILAADYFCVLVQGRELTFDELTGMADKTMNNLDKMTSDLYARNDISIETVRHAQLAARDAFLRRILIHSTAPLSGTA